MSAEWRSDEVDDAEFDAGFDAFIKRRNLPLFKKGEWPQEREKADKSRLIVEIQEQIS